MHSTNTDRPAEEAAPQGTRFSIATLMELTAACAVAASMSWMIGPLASVVLMLAAFGIVLKQGLVVLLSAMALCGLAGVHFIQQTHRGDYVAVVVSLVFIAAFAWYRATVRRRSLRRLATATDSYGQETEKGHSP